MTALLNLLAPNVSGLPGTSRHIRVCIVCSLVCVALTNSGAWAAIGVHFVSVTRVVCLFYVHFLYLHILVRE